MKVLKKNKQKINTFGEWRTCVTVMRSQLERFGQFYKSFLGSICGKNIHKTLLFLFVIIKNTQNIQSLQKAMYKVKDP